MTPLYCFFFRLSQQIQWLWPILHFYLQQMGNEYVSYSLLFPLNTHFHFLINLRNVLIHNLCVHFVKIHTCTLDILSFLQMEFEYSMAVKIKIGKITNMSLLKHLTDLMTNSKCPRGNDLVIKNSFHRFSCSC